jgi:hypothetical protein
MVYVRTFLDEQLAELGEHVPKAKKALLDKDRGTPERGIPILLELASLLSGDDWSRSGSTKRIMLQSLRLTMDRKRKRPLNLTDN